MISWVMGRVRTTIGRPPCPEPRLSIALTDDRMASYTFSSAFRRLLLLALTLAGFGWRVHALAAQSLWRDEVDAIFFALRDLPETLAMAVQPGQNGVLYFLSLRPWLQAVGTSEFADAIIAHMS